MKSVKQRFYEKIMIPKDENACWEWTGAKLRGGYGNMNINKRTVQAHRLSWAISFGEIPAGMLVCHHCDNPSCVNPNHLFLGTKFDNAQDRDRKNRQSRGENSRVAKLSDATVKEIRDLYSNKTHSMHKIGKMYNVAYSHINAIVHNRVRKHGNFDLGN